MPTVVQKFAPPFRNLPAFVCRLEILDILRCLILTLNVAIRLLLDAFRGVMPLVWIVVYEMEGLFWPRSLKFIILIIDTKICIARVVIFYYILLFLCVHLCGYCMCFILCSSASLLRGLLAVLSAHYY
jgi:hypothetical protein